MLREQGKIRRSGPRAGRRRRATCRDAGARIGHRLAIARSQLDEKRGDAARAARRLDEALGKDADPAKADVRLLLARAAVDDRRGDWQRAIARGERAAGEANRAASRR